MRRARPGRARSGGGPAAADSTPRGFTGDIEYCVLYAGESRRLIQDVKPAALIVHDLMREARVALDGLGRS